MPDFKKDFPNWTAQSVSALIPQLDADGIDLLQVPQSAILQTLFVIYLFVCMCRKCCNTNRARGSVPRGPSFIPTLRASHFLDKECTVGRDINIKNTKMIYIILHLIIITAVDTHTDWPIRRSWRWPWRQPGRQPWQTQRPHYGQSACGRQRKRRQPCPPKHSCPWHPTTPWWCGSRQS